MRPPPVIDTEFEIQVRQFGLSVQAHVSSAELKRWCERNLNRVHIPEWLLDEWGMRVELNFNDAA